jgi:hypothetical protein
VLISHRFLPRPRFNETMFAVSTVRRLIQPAIKAIGHV